MTGDFNKDLQELLKNKHFETLEEERMFVNEYRDKYNRIPIDELGGLSPEQMKRLLNTPLNFEECPLALSPELNEDDLKNSLFLGDAKTIMKLILENSPRATATKKLNREFVKTAIDKIGRDVDSLKEYYKSIREEDFIQLNVLHIILELAGFLRLSKGRFILSPKGRKYFSEKPGELFRLLFMTYLLKFNLSYLLFRWPGEYREIQNTINFSIYMVSKLCGDWISPADFSRRVLCDGLRLDMKYEMDGNEPYWKRDLMWAHSVMFLMPMLNFGLLEDKKLEGRKEYFTEDRLIRKTALFDKFIRIQF